MHRLVQIRGDNGGAGRRNHFGKAEEERGDNDVDGDRRQGHRDEMPQ